MRYHDLHTDHNDQSVRWTLGLWLLCIIILLVKCSPQAFQSLENAAFSATECGFHASTACSAQAAMGCGKSAGVSDWGGYGQCIADNAGPCITSGLAKCAAASIVKLTGAFVGGSSGCGSDRDKERVRLCVSQRAPSSEKEAILAVASCYVDACEED